VKKTKNGKKKERTFRDVIAEFDEFQRDCYEECAAVLEYNQNMPRELAELVAARTVRFGQYVRKVDGDKSI
jgi:hypothetical protein